MSKFILSIVLFLSFLKPYQAEELIAGSFKAKTIIRPAKWNSSGVYGGRVSFIDNKSPEKGVRLGTTRLTKKNGDEIWSGCLQWTRKPVQVLPGLKYSFEVEARGNVPIEIGVFELSWRYSAKIISTASKTFNTVNGEWNKYLFEYTPTSDAVMAVIPFVRLSGWYRFAEVRGLSFENAAPTSTLSVAANDFIVSPDKVIKISVKSQSFPVKILLYGPDGTSGAGGKMGGSSAWCDHFKMAAILDGKPDAEAIYDLLLPHNSQEGSYKLVVVDSSENSSAVLRFVVRPEEYAEKIRDLVKKIELPQGTKIIFVGDSLTDLFRGRNYVSLIKRALKWKFHDDVKIINAGVGGDNIKKIQKRLERDVISKGPTYIFIFEGANDTKRRYDIKTSSLRGWAVPQAEYEKTYIDVVKKLKAETKAKIIIATCAPVDSNVTKMFKDKSKDFDIVSNFYGTPDAEKEVVAIQKRIASDNGLDCIDSNAELNRYMKENNDSGAKQFLTVDDGVHLSEYGNREMARIILRYLSGE